MSTILAFASIEGANGEEAPLSFSRDVRPLLAKHCFACHGPDEDAREADLRLDTFDGATADLGDHRAIQPGAPESSALLARVTSTDADEVMPPPKSGPPLSAAQVEILRRWIASGAEYQQHWAFVPPRTTPFSKQPSPWTNNAIDAWVFDRLEREAMTPSSKADRVTLARRLFLDLTGVPPTPDDIDRYLNDQRPDADQRLIDRLLASERYGEKWGRAWLDLARYSDTNGYEKDRPRSIWPYREWVISALNQDMPFDQFTIEQLAGDMLPDATEAQRIATGFHRNTMLNEEGGIDPLEYRFYAMIDRVATTGTVWLGMTTGCAQCHTHKFDPLSHSDYYRMMALLNNADEPDLFLNDPEVTQKRNTVMERIKQAEALLAEQFPVGEGEGTEAERRQRHLDQSFTKWTETKRPLVSPWHVIRPSSMKTNSPRLELREDGSIYSSGDITKRDVFELKFSPSKELPAGFKVAAIRIEALPDESLPAGGPGRCYYEGRRGDFFLSEVKASQAGQVIPWGAASQDYGKLSIGSGKSEAKNVFDGDGSTGWSTSGREGTASQLVVVFKEPFEWNNDLDIEMLFERHFAASLGRFRISVTDHASAIAQELPVEVERLLTFPQDQWTEHDKQQLLQAFLLETPELEEARKPIQKMRNQLPDLPSTLVMQERPQDHPRSTYRYHRGEYLNPRETVEAGLPSVFPPLAENEAPNRLSFARWLVSDRNPLIARVTVNRVWQTFFGTGIVSTPGDFGTQSPPPSHPELLDSLAVDWMRFGWSQKRLHRQIVRSATYQQDARISPEQFAKDPTNMWLGRGVRIRMEGEVVRDAVLASSGLLVQQVGGASVRPPQPSAVTELAYGSESWSAAKGSGRYRRSLYTFSKRTAPFAAYATFDAPSGELCTVKRDRSNTPLQSLTLLNDEMFLEAARELGVRSIQAAEAPKDRLQWLYQWVLSRPANDKEQQTLLEYATAQRQRMERHELDASVLLGSKEVDSEAAVWMLVARVVLNLDEAVNRP